MSLPDSATRQKLPGIEDSDFEKYNEIVEACQALTTSAEDLLQEEKEEIKMLHEQGERTESIK